MENTASLEFELTDDFEWINGMLLETLEEEEREEDFHTRLCPFNFKPICLGSFYGYYECLGNPAGCVYNINDLNFGNFEGF